MKVKGKQWESEWCTYFFLLCFQTFGYRVRPRLHSFLHVTYIWTFLPKKNYMTYMHAFKFRKHIHKSAARQRKKADKNVTARRREKRKSPYFSSLRRVAEKTTGDFFPMVLPLYYSIYGCECNFLPKNRPRSSVVHPSKKKARSYNELQWKEHIFFTK